MFDLPAVDNPFKVDDKQLTRQFRKLQQTIHPDAWSAKGKVRVKLSEQISNVPFRQRPRTRHRRKHLLLQICPRW